MPTTPQGQITLAVISSQLIDLRVLVEKSNAKLDAVKECQDKMAHLPGDVKELQDDMEQVKQDLTETRTRTGVIGGLNAALATIGSVISGYLGTR
jgi:DNA repair ATPase RecN